MGVRIRSCQSTADIKNAVRPVLIVIVICGVGKSVFAEPDKVSRKLNFFKIFAVAESIHVDLRNTVGYGYFGEVTAVKRRLSYFLNTAAERNML